MNFDHLVLGADTLQQGLEYVEDLLGVRLPMGGRHQRFGTHNALMRFAAGGYLEIIAVDPDAQPEQRPRWFSLDEPEALAQIRQQPRLLTWVVNTGARSTGDVIQGVTPGVVNGVPNPLVETPMQRGSLHWNMLIPKAGRQTDLLFPWIIQWPPGPHPSEKMVDLQCELLSIVGSHDRPAELAQLLRQINCEQLLEIENVSENAGIKQLKAHVSCAGRQAIFYGLQEKTVQ